MSADGDKETLGFQTEVKQLLDLMVNSLYSNKEIFLRELISNASDAADKLRFEALSNDHLYEGDGDLRIHVEHDKEARTLRVRDNGVGMGYQEIIENLGTIARSGTRHFFEALTGDRARDAQLIGQFGVGFYSCFIVADKVTVSSRRAGMPVEGGVRWESSGDGEYTVERVPIAARGTEVTLSLREGEEEFLESYRLRNIVRRYSDHISIPIWMPKTGEDGEWESVNSATALWTRSRNEIEENEYREFYKHTAHDFEDPLVHVHSRVEGNLEYISLFYIPSRAPFDLWDRNVRRGVKLYVRRVFIMDDAEQLMPAYLRFVRGIIDCADLPLNVSREILQKDKRIDQIRSGSVKRVLDLLSGMAKNDAEKYAKFWDEFGKVLKEGVVEDAKNRESIAKLLRYASSRSSGEVDVSLEDYVGRMREGQEKIYYLTADRPETARSSPHLEAFVANDIEVLLMTDEVDEWVVHHLDEFDGKALQSVAKGELDLSAIAGVESAAESESDETGRRELVEDLARHLKDRVSEVRATRRLTNSPACLVASDTALGANFERLLQAAGQSVESSKPVLEINPDHPLLMRLRNEKDEARRKEWAELLVDQATLAEGGRLADPGAFVNRSTRSCSRSRADRPGALGRPGRKGVGRRAGAGTKAPPRARIGRATARPHPRPGTGRATAERRRRRSRRAAVRGRRQSRRRAGPGKAAE